MTHARLGTVLVLVAATTFGINAGVTRVALRAGVDAMTFTSLRITAAATVLALIAAVISPASLRIPRRDEALLFLAFGALGVASLQLTYNIAINRIPLGMALLLEYLAVVLVVLWARFVRAEAVHRRVIVAVVCCVAGVAAVGQVWQGLTLDALGVAMGLAAAVSLASYFILGERHAREAVGRVDSLHLILWGFVCGAVIMNLVAPSWRVPDLGMSANWRGPLSHINTPLWVPIVLTVVLGTVVPFFCELLALRVMPATVVTVLSTLEPVVAIIVGWAWWYEVLDASQLIGCVLIMSGIWLAQSSRAQAPPIPES